MQLLNFLSNGHDNIPCEFVFVGDIHVTGIISAFFLADASHYQLVESVNIHAFKQSMHFQDIENMQRLSTPVHLCDIISARNLN